jgi:translation initiation factor IF-3
MEVIGKIKVVQNVVEKGTFKSKNIVVKTDEQYPQHILVQFVQDKCDLLNNYKEGQDVKVSINLRGREWTNPQGEVVYFNTIQGWRIESANVASANHPTNTATANKAKPQTFAEENEQGDGLPF